MDNPPISARRRLLCMLALLSAALLSSIDITIANTALPQMAIELHTSETSIIWVANAYQVAMIAALLPFSSLGESIGYKKVFIFGLTLFGIASAICGGAQNLSMVIAGRALEGIGAAAMMAVIGAFIRLIYPPEMLGKGLGTNALVVAVGFTLGPVMTSLILSVATWHWLFFINLPVAVLGVYIAIKYLPATIVGNHPFNYVSASLCAIALGLLTLGLCSVQNGGGPVFALIVIIIAFLVLAFLLYKERKSPAPILLQDLFRIRVVRLSSFTSICAFTTQSLGLIGLPFLFEHSLNISVVKTGFILAAWPLMVAIMAMVTAQLIDRKIAPAGILCSIGLIGLTAGMWLLATMPEDTSDIGMIFRLALCGIGFGLFQAPNMREIMTKSPTHRNGGASGLVQISRLLGQTTGAALVAQCFNWWPSNGPTMSLWLGGGCALVGSVFSVMRLRKGKKSIA